MRELRRHLDRVAESVLPYQTFEAAEWHGPPTLSIACDDGYAEDLSEISPLLLSRGLRGTFAICADLVGRPGHLNDDGLIHLIEAGHELASHMVKHAPLTTLKPGDCLRDMAASKDWLRQRGGTAKSLVFPYGANSRQVRHCAARHFDVALSAWPGLVEGRVNAFSLRRVGFGSFEHKRFPVSSQAEIWMDRLHQRSAWMILMLHTGEARRLPDQSKRLERTLDAALKRGITIEPVNKASLHLRHLNPMAKP